VSAGGSGRVTIGIDALLATPERYLGSARRVALLANQASLTTDGRTTLEALRACPEVELVALLTPEHGWSGFEDDATSVPDRRDPTWGLAQHSLYGPRRRPDPAVLASVDAVVVDVQEVGVRCYTYATSLALLLEAAAESGTRVVVCDRPNLLGGRVDGPPLDPAHRSFLGYLDVPFQHGLTIGEVARFHAGSALGDGVDLRVVPLSGWSRGEGPPSPWVPPSPGLPTLDAVRLYPGLVLLEGCNLSEGRGTPLPFGLLGAPWLEGYALARELGALRIPGLRFRPLSFRPVTDTHRGETCHGVQLHVVDADALRPLTAMVSVLTHLHAHHRSFEWVDAASRPWASEDGAGEIWHEPSAGPLVDGLTGGGDVRSLVEGRGDAAETHAAWARAAHAHVDAAQPSLLYAPEPTPPAGA
jgi:uncharacterized protein YbbC (DUF1343 family)